MPKQNLSAELTIDAKLGSKFRKSFSDLDSRIDASTNKMRNMGSGVLKNMDRTFDAIQRRVDRMSGSGWNRAVNRMTENFRTGFRKVTDSVTSNIKRKFADASKTASAIWRRDFSKIGAGLTRRGPPGQQVESQFRTGIGNIGQGLGQGITAAGLLALSAGFKIREVFRDTNSQIEETGNNLRNLKKQGKNYEELAKHAREMGKAVSPWLQKIDRVNDKIDEQTRKLDRLRMARDRFNRSQRAWGNFKDQFAPTARRAGYAGIGMGIAGGYAALRGVQQYANLDHALRVLQAEGIKQTEIPIIRENIFKLAETTEFTEIDIANILVGMKKDGQTVDATLTGVSDILKLAVAESKDLNTAWEATRTIINSTQTDLAGALRLQEQLSNATSLSSLQLEDLQYIAGQSLAIYQGIDAFQSADFLAFAGQLGPLLRKERIATGLREFALTMSTAAAGKLAAPRQEAFDLLNINIADEQGRLKDAVSILKEFESAFNAPQFLDKEGKQIGDKIQTNLAEIFGREAAPAVVGLIGKSEQIAENIDKINTEGTIQRKFDIMDKRLTASAKKFQSAVSVASQRFFLAIDDNASFARLIDKMTAATQKLSGWIDKNKNKIRSAYQGIASLVSEIFGMAQKAFNRFMAYLVPRLPKIKRFFTNFWEDVKQSWKKIQPIAGALTAVFGRLLDVIGRFAGENTGMLSWLFLAAVGWKALKLPIMAVTSAYHGVAGVVMLLQSHFGSLRDIISASIGKARQLSQALSRTPIPAGVDMPVPVDLPDKTKSKRRRFLSKEPSRRRAMAPTAEIPTVLPNKKTPKVKTPKLPTAKPRIVKSIIPKLPKLGILSSIGTVLLKIGNIAKWIMIPISYLVAKLSFLAPVVTAVGTAIAAIGSAIAAIGIGPVVAVVAAIVALWTAAIALILKNWEKVKGAAIAVWGTIKTFGSAVWETFKFVVFGISDLFSWLGGAIWNVIGPVATTTGKVFSSVGTGIGKSFMAAFGGIKTFAVAVWNFVSNLFGTLFGWIESIASKFTGWFDSWKNFFKKRNEERTGEIKLKETIEKAPIEEILDRNIDIYENRHVVQNMSPIDENAFKSRAVQVPVQFTQIDELTIDENAPLQREINTIYKERIEKAPIEDIIKVNEQLIENPLANFASDVAIDPIEMTAQTPDFSQIAKNAAMDIEADFTKNQKQSMSQIQNYDTTSVEYIDFSSVDEIDKTLKAGFTSLENINSQIITELQKMRGVEIKPPEIRTPESNIDIQTPGVDIQIPQTPEIRTPESNINIQTPPVPRSIINEKENIIRETLVNNPPAPADIPQLTAPDISPLRIDGIPQLTAPNIPQLDAPNIDSPVLSAPEIAPVAIDGIPQLTAPDIPQLDAPKLTAPNIPQLDAPNIDSPVLSAPEILPIPVQSIMNPQLEYDPIKVERSEPPVHRVEISPIRVEASQKSETGDTVEITNHITINQQPGEDAEQLTERILKEMNKQQRARAYD